MISSFLTRPIPKPSKPPVNDPQRVRLYRLEREYVGASVNHKVSQQHLREISAHVCAYYQIEPIQVVVFDAPSLRLFGEYTYYECANNDRYFESIRLNRGFHGANATTLMHELAHYITDNTYEDHQGHGKKFVGVYMHLLDKYRILPSVAFRALAKKWGVKIAGKFKPNAIRG